MLSKARSSVKSFIARRSSSTPSTKSNGRNSIDSNSNDDLNLNNQQRIEKNEEDITIVWLSKGAKYTEEQLLIENLRSINDYIQFFSDEEDALGYIESINEEKIFIIIDYYSDHLLNILEGLKQVDKLFLYISTSVDKIPLWITAHCSTKEQLIDEIKIAHNQLIKHMIDFSIYSYDHKDKDNFIHETSSFLFFQLFETAFKILPQNSESKKLMISKCRDYYSTNESILQEINNFNLHYKSNDALQWYRNNSFIYRLVNKALRTENVNSLCYLHFYINDISKQLEKEFIKFKKNYSKSIIKFYRAFKMSQEELKSLEHNIKNLLITNGYLSTTQKYDNVYDYIIKENIKSNEEKVLFEYTVDLTHVKSIVFADISQYNGFLEENEILFDIGAVFKIDSCTYNTENNFWLINVSATDEGANITSEYLKYQKAKMTESNTMLTLGHLIIEIGDYDKAEKYFDAILNSSVPNDEETACIYYNIGRIYRLKGEYQRAFDFLYRAYQAHHNARPARLISAAKTINAIGIVHMEQNNVQHAIDAFEQALRLYSKTIDLNHPDVGGTLINLGNIYCEQGQFENAFSCFNRAQIIYDNNLPTNHPNKAMLLNNIGNLHYQQLELDLALDAYQQALAINAKVLPPNHPDIARNKHNLSKVYTALNDPSKVSLDRKRSCEYIKFTRQPTIEVVNIRQSSSNEIEMEKKSRSRENSMEMTKW